MDSNDTSVSLAPTPQLAPMATGGNANPSNTWDRSLGNNPIIVRPAVSKEQVAVYGRPACKAPVAAARISSAADMVSIHPMSAPPSLRPRASSPNDSTAASPGRKPGGPN